MLGKDSPNIKGIMDFLTILRDRLWVRHPKAAQCVNLCMSVCVQVPVSKGNGRGSSEVEGRLIHLHPGPPFSPQGFHFKKVGLGRAIKVLFQIKVILMLLIESEEAVVMKCFTFYVILRKKTPCQTIWCLYL